MRQTPGAAFSGSSRTGGPDRGGAFEVTEPVAKVTNESDRDEAGMTKFSDVPEQSEGYE
jgi:hypothetical protein